MLAGEAEKLSLCSIPQGAKTPQYMWNYQDIKRKLNYCYKENHINIPKLDPWCEVEGQVLLR